jgi:hypothetical protein
VDKPLSGLIETAADGTIFLDEILDAVKNRFTSAGFSALLHPDILPQSIITYGYKQRSYLPVS